MLEYPIKLSLALDLKTQPIWDSHSEWNCHSGSFNILGVYLQSCHMSRKCVFFSFQTPDFVIKD